MKSGKEFENGLYEALLGLSREGRLPLHVPGHKRRKDKFGYLNDLGGGFDITEIEGFDNLHNAKGILKKSMDTAADLWGAKRSFYLVNGSTCGIHAAIRAVCRRGNKIIIARNCHRSVYAAMELNGLEPIFITPETVKGFGLYSSVTPEAAEEALINNPDAQAMIITSPTYDGVISDIGSISEIAKKYGVILIVDEAHGAHLGFSPYFPGGAVVGGADIVIQSLHKTLPCLTQTAILHNVTGRVDSKEIEKQLSVFQTSSPSYILMASIDSCVRYLKENGSEAFKEAEEALSEFYERSADMEKLAVFAPETQNKASESDVNSADSDFTNYGISGHGGGFAQTIKRNNYVYPSVYLRDKSRIYVSCLNCSLTGFELKRILCYKFGIELEKADHNGATAVVTLADGKEELQQLSDALLKIDKEISFSKKEPLTLPVFDVSMYCGDGKRRSGKRTEENGQSFMRSDDCSETIEIPSGDAAGKICAENICVYPPGIPVVFRGMRLNKDILDYLERSCLCGAEILSDSGGYPSFILCYEN